MSENYDYSEGHTHFKPSQHFTFSSQRLVTLLPLRVGQRFEVCQSKVSLILLTWGIRSLGHTKWVTGFASDWRWLMLIHHGLMKDWISWLHIHCFFFGSLVLLWEITILVGYAVMPFSIHTLPSIFQWLRFRYPHLDWLQFCVFPAAVSHWIQPTLLWVTTFGAAFCDV